MILIARFTRPVLLAALLQQIVACGASGGSDSESHFVEAGSDGHPKPRVARLPEGQRSTSELADGGTAVAAVPLAAAADVADAGAPLVQPIEGQPSSTDPRDAGALAPSAPSASVEDASVAELLEASVSTPVSAATSIVPPVDAALVEFRSAPKLATMLTDAQLWALGVGAGASGLGECYVEDSTAKTGLCDYYVKCATQGDDLDFGWPKSATNTSTGCVYGPNTGKQQSFCFYPERAADFCTQDTRTNVLSQLRDALANDVCGDVSMVSIDAEMTP